MVLQELIDKSPLALYIGLAGILALLEWALVVCGRKYQLGPEVSSRSLHTKFTPTGGGFVWVLAGITGVLMFGSLQSVSTWIFIAGIFILAVISYIDDINPLPPVPRLICQIVILALTFKQLCNPQALDIFLIIIFCGVGIINAINFLDGICGMLALYGIVVTATLLYTLYLVQIPELMWFIPVLWMIIVAQVVFACFNLTDSIFAGDTGSITLGYIQIVAAISIVLATKDGSYIIFFSVCIFDTGLTTLQRLFSGISILKPHRANIYQLLTTVYHLPHVVVAIIYALLQLLINALFFLIPVSQHWTYFLLVSAMLTISYFLVRFSFPSPWKNFSSK